MIKSFFQLFLEIIAEIFGTSNKPKNEISIPEKEVKENVFNVYEEENILSDLSDEELLCLNTMIEKVNDSFIKDIDDYIYIFENRMKESASFEDYNYAIIMRETIKELNKIKEKEKSLSLELEKAKESDDLEKIQQINNELLLLSNFYSEIVVKGLSFEEEE